MSRSLTVPACARCGHAMWPPRPVCPRCSATAFHDRDAGRGVIEATTRSEETLLASVRTLAGPIVIARLRRHATVGADVELTAEAAPAGGVIVGASPTLKT